MERTIRLGYNSGSGVISGVFYRLLPVQILLMVLASINTIVDGLFASNFISRVAMDATGLFSPISGVINAFGIGDVMNLSEKFISFCTQKGLDAKRAYYAGLCLEEMAGNIVLHGFEKDKKNHAVDMRVVFEEDQLVIRLSDNCIPFNPKERAEIINPEDITKNIGVRMVARIAKSMQYQNMLGLNVLTRVI